MKREDLKLGEYYVYDKRQVLIFKGINVNTKTITIEGEQFSTQNYSYTLSDIRLATPEEKHWLDVCINKDTFVPREIATASFKSTKIDFIPGKWYRSTPEANNRGGEIYYGKFLEFRGDAFIASSSRVTGMISTATYNFNSGYIWEPLTDLSEIQDFLFEGHPDKVVKTEKILGKFDIGNIVVSLSEIKPYRAVGDLFRILANSNKSQLYYKNDRHSQELSEWRLSTDEEALAYNNGVTNIKQLDVPKEIYKPVVSQFLKDDYIVILQEVSPSFPKNYVFKQRETFHYLRVYKDIRGKNNGNTIADISKSSLWRYATTQEIMEYNIQDRPVDVTRIGMVPKTVLPAHDHKWVVRRTQENRDILNHWANSQKGGAYGHSSNDGWMHSVNYGIMGHSGAGHFYSDPKKHPDHTEITTEQFKRDIMRLNEYGEPATGAPIVYNRDTHEFATIVSYSYIKNPDGSSVKTLKDLPKKAKMSDVSALVKHQEPVIVNRQKTKRSKLITINK